MTDAVEFANVPVSNTGDVYILLITNYANTPTDIIANQTGGTGTTNCGIIPPCAADVGTIDVTTTGTGSGTNNLTLCIGDNFSLDSQGDYNLPPNEPGEESELMYAVFDCPPTAPINTDTDPCFSGLYWTGEDLIAGDPGTENTDGGVPQVLNNAGITGSNNTVWYVPVTVDDGDNNNNPNDVINVDQNNDNCYDFGTPIEVIYLEDVIVTSTSDCDVLSSSGSVTFTVSGGAPANGQGSFTVINNGPGTASPTTVPNGGSTTVATINDGQTASVSFTDANGCLYGPFTFDFSCGDDACLINSSLTANPPPSSFPNGQYPPGTVVEFCFDIDQYNQTNVNFLHGIVPSFTGAWDGPAIPTVTPAVAANNEQGSYWDWLPGGSVSNNITGATITDDGWWFFSVNSPGGAPANTGDSWGDGCTAVCDPSISQFDCTLALGTWVPGCGCTGIFSTNFTQASCVAAGGIWDPFFGDCELLACLGNANDGFGLTWQACFTLTASLSCSPEESMGVSIKTYADGETGICTDIGLSLIHI